MRRLLTMASVVTTTGLLCGAALLGTTAASASTSTSASVTHAQPGGPMVHANGAKAASTGAPTISENWSGYATTSNKKFTYVHSTFVQPTLTCAGGKNQWTSDWVGLDGYSTNTVEQDGTFAHCGGSDGTTPVYKAWFEMYPAGSVNVFKVHPGDVIDSSVSYAGSTFSLTIADLTTGKTHTDNATCATCERTSAEWIIERPALCNAAETKCFITKLANFGTSTMGGDEAQLTGGKVKGVGGFSNIPIDMVNPLKKGGFISLATVGPLTGKTFTATWDRAGTKVPIDLG
jgi:hypothetical protein